MKKYSKFVFLLSMFVYNGMYAQTVKDIFDPSVPVTYIGIDFSNAHYFGDPGSVLPGIMPSYLKKINDVVKNEPDKYDLAGALKRAGVAINLEPTDIVNATIDSGFVIWNIPKNTFLVNQGIIKKMVTRYELKEKGIGMVFIMDNMIKPYEEETLWVVLFNIETREVLLQERMKETVEGFGFRNHWVSGIYGAIKDIKGSWKDWKKKYGQR